MQEGELGPRLREYMRQEGLSETEIAKRAKVSQAAVSRALSRPAQRRGRAWSRLFVYLQERTAPVAPGTPEDAVVIAFRRIWDRSEEHAAAIARIISASGGLRPKKPGEE
jgi:predicted transcriptional regulator